MPKSKPLTEQQRAARRAADREYSRQAVEQLRSSEGWQRWLKTRASFHRYSVTNQLLIALQRPTAKTVAGFRKWLALGYCVRKGETAIWIWAPCPPSAKKLQAWRDAGSKPEERPQTFFRLTAVFGDDEVDELPLPAEPAPIACPMRELTGDDLDYAIVPLIDLAGEIGSAVTIESIPAAHGLGYYDPRTKRIVISGDVAINEQVSVLCHELAHALVRADHQDGDRELDYASEELVAESVAFTVIRSLGIDADSASIPYLASWAESTELAVIEKTAGLIDRLAKRLEDALTPEADDTPDTDDIEQLAGP
jgi:antirestriction protein ArdC